MDMRIGGSSIYQQQTIQGKREVKRESFQGSMEQVIKAGGLKNPKDSITFSGDSTHKKLEKIKELNRNTDFSNMTDAEKYGVIYERYEEAFPYISATGFATGDQSPIEELDKDLRAAGVLRNGKKVYLAYRGYDKMTMEERLENIYENFGNPKNGLEQLILLGELMDADCVDSDMGFAVADRIIRKAERAWAPEHGRDFLGEKLFSDERLLTWSYEYLENHTIDINIVGEELTYEYATDSHCTPEEKKWYIDNIDYIIELMKDFEEREDTNR